MASFSPEVQTLLALMGSRPVLYHPVLARIFGGVKQAIFFGQLMYWHGKGHNPDGWIWKTQAEWEEEIAFSRTEQETVRRHLRKLGVLEEELRGVPGVLHYRPNLERVGQMIAQYAENLHAEKPHTHDVENPQSITENTYTENTTDSPAQPPGSEEPEMILAADPARGNSWSVSATYLQGHESGEFVLDEGGDIEELGYVDEPFDDGGSTEQKRPKWMLPKDPLEEKIFRAARNRKYWPPSSEGGQRLAHRFRAVSKAFQPDILNGQVVQYPLSWIDVLCDWAVENRVGIKGLVNAILNDDKREEHRLRLMKEHGLTEQGVIAQEQTEIVRYGEGLDVEY